VTVLAGAEQMTNIGSVLPWRFRLDVVRQLVLSVQAAADIQAASRA